MFVNNANGQRGLVCQYDVVCFDEVSGISFDQKDGVNIMKGYMESGEFSRGKEPIRADGGIAMVGNFDVDVEHLGTIRAQYVVAADGMWSPVRKALGVSTPGYLGEWHAFRQYANTVTGPAKDRLYVWFEKDLLPGYAWSFPLQDGRVNIGFGILRGSNYTVQQMKDLWPELLQRKHIAKALGPNVVMEDRHTAWPIPARVTSATLTNGRVLFVGDAACVTDTLTGEGIGHVKGKQLW
jgi:flavin-dependent dehydrogenase